jgi:23S rRNA (uracil1939-C5)-methyltransferase
MTNDIAEIDVRSIAAGGDGVGRLDRLAVFVPRTAPGDRVRARIAIQNRFARGTLLDVLEPSVDRIEPPCGHYRVDRCGGCQLQHLSYDAQLRAKAGIVRDSLQRIGKRQIELPQVRASEREWRYRTKLTLAMQRVDDGWVIGLHPYDDAAAVFQLADCPITDERVIAVWKEIMRASAFYPEASALRTAVRLLDAGAAVTVEGGARWRHADEFFAAVPSATELWWVPDDEPRRQLAARSTAPGEAHTGASFAQVNPVVARELQAYVVDRVRGYRPRSVIDAYAGVGDTAEPLARDGARVTAIELDRDAARRCAARLPSGSRVLTGRVEDLLARALPADVVIVNPPRGGLHDRVPGQLLRASPRPRAVVYVSCSPGTLARDLARLADYRLASIVSFDMFPQTAHVETVCELVPEAA